jgi:hypothetical protein
VYVHMYVRTTQHASLGDLALLRTCGNGFQLSRCGAARELASQVVTLSPSGIAFLKPVILELPLLREPAPGW